MITADHCCICLKSQLCLRAIDLSRDIADDVIAPDQGVAAIFLAPYKRDALSVIDEAYTDFTDPLALRRALKERFIKYKAKFVIQIAKLNAHDSAVSLHESLLEMMLLAGSSIDDSQRILILTAADGRQYTAMEPSNDTIVSHIKYDNAVSILRHWDTRSFSTRDHKARNF